MSNGQPSTPKLKSYVWHGERCFFVSTVERDSSASGSYGARFDETIAFEFNFETNSNGEIVAHTGDGEAFRQHSEVCRQLFQTGQWTDPRDE